MAAKLLTLDGEVPSAFVQTARPSAKVRRKQRRTRLTVTALLLLLVAGGIANLLAALSNWTQVVMLGESSQQNVTPSFKSRYDDLGAQVVIAWLEGGSPVVDSVEAVTWPGLAGLAPAMDVSSVGYLDGRAIDLPGTEDLHESLTYVVVDTAGQQYLVTVELGVSVRRNEETGSSVTKPILLSSPLVIPRNEVNVISGSGAPGWPTFAIDSGSPLTVQALQWVEAWTANNPQALKSLTGDASSAEYVGMQDATRQWSVVDGSTNVNWAATRPSDGAVVARVTWQMAAPRPVASNPESSKSDAAAPKPAPQSMVLVQSMDLLVLEADTGLPKIAAWGAPGTYQNLVAYQNASTNK